MQVGNIIKLSANDLNQFMLLNLSSTYTVADTAIEHTDSIVSAITITQNP